jgi:ribosomal protein S1
MISFLLGLGIGGVIIYFIITNWRNLKSFVGDLFASVGFLGKWFRKKSVESKYETIINGAINDYNSNFEDRIIPNCKIKWITNDTEESYFEDNKAIICLKFDKKNQDLNFYNATYSFTRTGLLPVTRNFVNVISQKAIDLNLTKIFIRDYNRKALNIFNQKYRTEDQSVKDSFIKFEETEKRGLFSSLLIPELHYLGDSLETETPNDKIEAEIDDFFDWFYDLATREKEDRTILNYHSTHIKVGVILVANLDTYNSYGIEAYTKWAEKYASDHYGAVYLFARGSYRSKILKEVVSDLTNKKGFDQINKRVSIFETTESGEKVNVTCSCLKPNLSKVQYNAWEKIKTAFNGTKQINGIVKTINIENIEVNVHGLDFLIPKNKLSTKEIPDLSRFFYPEQELLLNIESYDEEACELYLNNVGTDSDPTVLIDLTLQNKKSIDVIVKDVNVDTEGRERGLKTFCSQINRKVFIPHRYCSYSRFINLTSSFPRGTNLKVLLHGFSMEFANFIGEIADLENPNNKISNYQQNKKYSAIVQEISDSYLTTELLPGLECRVYRSELSWDDSTKPENFKIGDNVEIIIIRIDDKSFHITGSLKRVLKSDNEKFYEQTISEQLDGVVIKTYEGIGLKFKLDKFNKYGFVYAKELMWGFCSNIEENFPIESRIKIKPIDFDIQNNEISYSIKACQVNDYDKVSDDLIIGEQYNGKIIKHFTDMAIIEINVNSHLIQGYIHKSEISNIEFVAQNEIDKFLPIDNYFNFHLKRRDNKNKVIELSRKSFLISNHQVLEYGDTLLVKIVKVHKDYAFFYEDLIEGKITENFNKLTNEDEVDVFLINSKNEFSV